MKRFGLIGHPIAHSLSPAMFRSCYPEWDYDLIDTADFEEAWQRFLEGLKTGLEKMIASEEREQSGSSREA